MSDKIAQEPQYTERQLRVIAEIQRVAQILATDRLSKRDFDKHHQLVGLSTAGYQFGSWNRAVRAAGLEPRESGQSNLGPKLCDEELLREIIRLHQQLGKQPSASEMARFGQWGSWVSARDAAYARYGIPSEIRSNG